MSGFQDPTTYATYCLVNCLFVLEGEAKVYGTGARSFTADGLVTETCTLGTGDITDCVPIAGAFGG